MTSPLLALLAVAQTNAPPAVAAPTPPDNEIEDIRPPYFYLHAWNWWWVAAGVLALLLLAAILYTLLHRQRQLSPKSAYELALEKLEEARALLREDKPMPYAVLVSETVRSYLGQRFSTPSTRRTTDEFMRQMTDDPATPLAPHRDLLSRFLQACDLVKFARYQPTLAELEQVQQRALDFVHATRPAPAGAEPNGRPVS